MKRIFLLLLLLNIAFFAWQYQKEGRGPVKVEEQLSSDNTVARLVLPSEVANNRKDEGLPKPGTGHVETRDEPQEIEQEKKPVFVCYTIGPFADRNSSRELSATLNESGLVAETRETEQRKHKDYWVHLPIENTLSSARRIVRNLKDRKISDVSVVPLDDGRYAISLGIFSTENRAQRRYSQFVSMGFKPSIEDRYKTTTVMWVDVKDNEPSLLAPEVWQDLTGKFAGVKRVEITCQ